MKNTKKMSVQTLVLGAILTALVILLQYAGSFIKFGMFSVSLVLIPIVIGAITCGEKMGAWLGFVFGGIVLLSGDATPFLVINVPGTILTVLLKGILCGYISGITYKAVNKLSKNNTVSAITSAIVCPVINTGIFILGCLIFFIGAISLEATNAGMSGNIMGYILTAYVTLNFVFELLLNTILAPVIAHILKATKRI